MANSDLMKSFSSNCKEYSLNRTEESAGNLQRALQILSASSEPCTFDPGRREVVDFFVNLHELMLSLDTRSNIIWTAANLLQEASRNPTARNALIHTYKFAPILTRLLSAQLTNEKRLMVLNLLQELTYGIKITWQEAHLPQLISLLTKWITSDDANLVPVSLGVLVNLCYKNLPAVYALMRAVDIKKFLKVVLRLQQFNDRTRVQVCKLLIILECVSGEIPDSEVHTYIKATCPTLTEALCAGNACLMRHVVDFFKEILILPKASEILKTYSNYPNDIEGVLRVLQNEETVSNECLSVMFEFLCCVVGLGRVDLSPLLPQLLDLSLRWMRTDGVSTQALTLLTTVTTYLSSDEFTKTENLSVSTNALDILEQQLHVILLLLDTSNGVLGDSETFSRLTALLQLLNEMIQIPSLCPKISKSLNQNMVRSLFASLLSSDSKEGNNLFQQPTYMYYVQALCFLMELANRETDWLLLYSELVQESQIQMVLAISLYTGPEHIKKKVLSFIGTAGFTAECYSALANRMSELNKLVIFSPLDNSGQEISAPSVPNHISPLDITPLLTITQEGHLNTTLDKCEKLATKNESSMTSAMMELFQYKTAAMSHTIRHMQSSQQAADDRATKLQHSLALTSAEVSRLHQILHSNQQALETKCKEVENLTNQITFAQEQASETHNKYTQLLQSMRSKTLIITEQNEEIEKMQQSLNDKQKEIEKLESSLKSLQEVLSAKGQELEEANKDLQGMTQKNEGLKNEIMNLEASLEAAKRASVEDKKEIDCRNKKIDVFRKESMNQKSAISKLEKAVNEKEQQISSMNKELQDMRRMGEIISELATGKRKFDNQ